MSCHSLASSIQASLREIVSEAKPLIPLATPAVLSGTCQVDRALLFVRVSLVAFAAFALFVVASAVSLPFAVTFPVLVGVTGGIALLDRWLSVRWVNRKAIAEYEAAFPSGSAMALLSKNIESVRILVQKRLDLNKTDEHGCRLLDHAPSLDVFKLLVDHGANLKAHSELGGRNYFTRLVQGWDPQENLEKVDYVLQKGYGTIEDLNEDDLRFDMYMSPSIPMVNLLVQYGLKLQTEDRFGRSHLERLLTGVGDYFSDAEYPLQPLPVVPSSFSPEAQIRLWLNVRNSRAIGFLLKKGFDINVRDKEGFTPLLRLVQTASSFRNYFFRLEDHLRALLRHGADPKVVVSLDGQEKTALQLNTKPSLEPILRAVLIPAETV